MEKSTLKVFTTKDPEILEKAYKLRYQVFAEEMGAELPDYCAESGLDKDYFDGFCEDLVVMYGSDVVGYTRILNNDRAARAGGFYSEGLFTGSFQTNGLNFMEIGRTCIHPDHRNGRTILKLWRGIGEYIYLNQIDTLIGSASIPIGIDSKIVSAALRYLYRYRLPMDIVVPKIGYPVDLKVTPSRNACPSLVQTYINLGARIGGQAYYDEDFRTVDVFIVLKTESIPERYAKHFIK